MHTDKNYKYTEITKDEAKIAYCKGDDVYVSTDKRKYWKMPASYDYGSHAPIETLFHRSIPNLEGDVMFFKRKNNIIMR